MMYSDLQRIASKLRQQVSSFEPERTSGPDAARLLEAFVAIEKLAAAGKLLAARRVEPPQGEILGVRVPDEGVKFALIAEEPRVYFTTPHFDGYPAVLVRLEAIDERGLRELIVDAWLTQAPKRLVQEFLDETK